MIDLCTRFTLTILGFNHSSSAIRVPFLMRTAELDCHCIDEALRCWELQVDRLLSIQLSLHGDDGARGAVGVLRLADSDGLTRQDRHSVNKGPQLIDIPLEQITASLSPEKVLRYQHICDSITTRDTTAPDFLAQVEQALLTLTELHLRSF